MLGFDALGRLALGEAPDKRVIASVGAFSVTGVAAGILATRTLSCASRLFAINGQDVGFARRIQCDSGEFTFTGITADVAAARYMTADAGSFTLTGRTAALSVSMPAATGSFAITGVAAGVSATRFVSAASGAFTLSGRAAGLAISMPAAVGSYAVTGSDARIVTGYVINCEPYVAALREHFGFAPLGAVSLGQAQISGGTTFAVTAQDIVIRVNMPADAGSFAVTGPSTTTFGRTRPKIRAFPRVGHGTVSARSRGRDEIKIRAYGG